MNKEKAIEVSKHYFKHYPTVNEVHFTKDGQAFHNTGDAQNHARDLANRSKEETHVVISVTRSEAAEELSANSLNDKKQDPVTPAKPEKPVKPEKPTGKGTNK